MEKEITLSIHALVDFLLRNGDIDSRIYNLETMKKGSEFHRLFQGSQSTSYCSEVFLKGSFSVDDYLVTLEGRADGIIDKGSIPIIEEIKSTVGDLYAFHESQKEWHLGQARCYALLYLMQEKKERALIRLQYLDQKDFHHRWFVEFLETKEQLESEVRQLIHEYLIFMKSIFHHVKERNESLHALSFPYPFFRRGQREMCKYVYGAAKKGEILFVEAPTGIGKTVSTLYPSLRAQGDWSEGKIFYLTAKTSGAIAAEETIRLLKERGAILRTSRLLAREKMCASPGSSCNPDSCPFAKNYYEKLRKILKENFDKNLHYSEQKIKELAKEDETCPFELSLDLSSFSDVIICDYNYLIDPFAYLERFFTLDEEAKKHYVLIDEAHNLIDRARECYSATIEEEALNKVIKISKKVAELHSFYLAFRALKKVLKEEKNSENLTHYFQGERKTLKKALNRIEQAGQAYMQEDNVPPLGQEIRDFTRETHRFFKIYEEYGDSDVLFTQNENGFALRLFCPDASFMLQEDLKRLRGATLFSGTLSPIEYYMSSIAGEEKAHLLLPSPFPEENCKIIVASKVSTRYKDREKTKRDVADYLQAFVQGKKGNYLLFMPSFSYLESIVPFLSFADADVYIQKRGMTDKEKSDFLSNFTEEKDKTQIGIAVIGGSLSEGIDLSGDRLIGVAIVGIGLPMVSFEREILREHFQQTREEGFNYAYRYPGMNKVMQALGRLIRSESDKGVVLLIDDRYLSRDYRSLLSRMHPCYQIATSANQVRAIVTSFYAKFS